MNKETLAHQLILARYAKNKTITLTPKNKSFVNIKTYYYDNNIVSFVKIYCAKENKQKSPVIINLNDEELFYYNENETFNIELAERGFIVVSISHRVIPENQLTVIIQDLFKAINHLNKLNDKYLFDWNNVSIYGRLSLYLNQINNSKKLQKLFNVDKIHLIIKNLVIKHNHHILESPINDTQKTFLKLVLPKKYQKYLFKTKDIKRINENLKILLISANNEILPNNKIIRLNDDKMLFKSLSKILKQ